MSYIERLKKKGYTQVTDTLFTTSDGCIFQLVEKNIIAGEGSQNATYLILVGKNGKINMKWCNIDCQNLITKKCGGDVCGFCSLKQDTLIGFIEDIHSKSLECIASGVQILNV